MPTFEQTSKLPVDAPTLYDWHARPGAFERLAPPWQQIEVLEQEGGIEDGARLLMKIDQGPLTLRWEARHRDHIEGEQFADEQIRGPFKRWVHTHRFQAVDDSTSRLVDHVDYQLPFGPLGAVFGSIPARDTLERMFAFRHRRTLDDLRRHADSTRPLSIAVTGSHGLIGSAVCAFLSTGGHDVTRLVRNFDQLDDSAVYWSPKSGRIDADGLEGVDAVIHLAGEGVVQPWTDDARRRIRDSRVDGTALLADALAGLDDPPDALLAASSVGYYGDTDGDIFSEDDGPGDGFLSEVAQDWEATTSAASDAGIRTVNMRIGAVLTPRGGTLERMVKAVRFGMAHHFGPGGQFVSWIDIDDVLGAIHFLLMRHDLDGPVNLTAPVPVENRHLMDVIGEVLNRPNIVPVPRRAVEWLTGPGAADETDLASQRVVPTRLEEAGFQFFYDDLLESVAMKFGDLALPPSISADSARPAR